MSEEEGVALMEGSQTLQQWNANCDAVKKACGGYPAWWYAAVIQSGLLKRVAPHWGGDDQIHVTASRPKG